MTDPCPLCAQDLPSRPDPLRTPEFLKLCHGRPSEPIRVFIRTNLAAIAKFYGGSRTGAGGFDPLATEHFRGLLHNAPLDPIRRYVYGNLFWIGKAAERDARARI